MMLGTYPISAVPISGIGQYAQLLADAGAYTVTGQTARFTVGLTGGVGSYSLTGQDARLAVVMRAGAGAYVLTGYPVTMRYIDNIRLRARDFSDFQYLIRDESEGYW